MKLLCDIYKSPKDTDMYLYVDKKEGLARVPEALLARFGKPNHVMTFILTEGRKLARADTQKVIAQLNDVGFYLQMPPPAETYMTAISENNSKIAK